MAARWCSAGRPVPRLMLHAAALTFPHPAGGERRVEAPVPADMAGLARALGLAIPERWMAATPSLRNHHRHGRRLG